MNDKFANFILAGILLWLIVTINKRTSWKRLNAWQIKLLMTFLMVLNHLEFGYGFISHNLQETFLLISRGVAPMFAYLAIGGILYSRNLKKYCLRLCIWATIVSAGNVLLGYILTNLSSDISTANQVYLTIRTNISITLACGVLCIALIIWGKDRKGIMKYLFFGLSTICFVIGFVVEWGTVLLPFMIVTYFLREKKEEKFLGYLVVEAITFLFRSEIYYLFVFPIIELYNGERGPNSRFNKYFFYIFYPLHLWFIAFINFVLLSK